MANQLISSASRYTHIASMARAVVRNRLRVDRPVVMMHAVTEACNARCPYCVFRHGKRPHDELSLAEIARLYGSARDVGIRYMHLWGGEPLVHPEIGTIAAMAKGSGMITGMVTNGFLLEKKCDQVLPHLDRLYVSIDHPSDKHDAFRKTPGLYARAMAGIERVRRQWPDQFVLLSFTLFQENADAVFDMAELCKKLGVRLWVNPMRAAANVGSDSTEARHNEAPLEVDNETRVIPWEQQVSVWNGLIRRRQLGYPIQNSIYYMRQLAKRRAPPTYRCHWPKIAVGIESNGDIVDCQRWGSPIANVREIPLPRALRLARAQELRGRVGEECNLCVSPARVEPSGLYGLKPGMLRDSLQRIGL